ncbi:hypothetical protein BGZ83_008818 [Gryganskiella cystojenkinii]|nr:hypothetical protein BGZ83_008818 [Gryganskiella cystojenkinii]
MTPFQIQNQVDFVERDCNTNRIQSDIRNGDLDPTRDHHHSGGAIDRSSTLLSSSESQSLPVEIIEVILKDVHSLTLYTYLGFVPHLSLDDIVRTCSIQHLRFLAPRKPYSLKKDMEGSEEVGKEEVEEEDYIKWDHHRFEILMFKAIEFGHLKTVQYLTETWGLTKDFMLPLSIFRCHVDIVDHLLAIGGPKAASEVKDSKATQAMYIIAGQWDKFDPTAQLDYIDYPLWQYPHTFSRGTCHRLLNIYSDPDLLLETYEPGSENLEQVFAVCCKEGYFDIVHKHTTETTLTMLYATRKDRDRLPKFASNVRSLMSDEWYHSWAHPEFIYNGEDKDATVVTIDYTSPALKFEVRPSLPPLKATTTTTVAGGIQFGRNNRASMGYRVVPIPTWAERSWRGEHYRTLTEYERMEITLRAYMWAIDRNLLGPFKDPKVELVFREHTGFEPLNREDYFISRK